MELKRAFGKALRTIRQARGLTQEDFSVVSSRTYLSSLERGQKSPTLDKIDELAGVLRVHPLSILALCYAQPRATSEAGELLMKAVKELETLKRRIQK